MPRDLNDVEREEGGAAVLEMIDGAPERPPQKKPREDKKPDKPAFRPPEIVHAGRFRSSEPPPREWLVIGWLPANEVSMLGADGGTGKTTLALQLHVACETGGLWLGKEVLDCPSLYYGGEEPWAELHLRYKDVARPVLLSPIHDFEMISVADHEDPALIEIGESGKPEPTAMLAWLEAFVKAKGIRLVILDAAADVCAINENDRTQVRRAVAILRGFAIRNRCAILLLAHPSVEGMRSGRGYSGSTHWNNAVRARMYFTTPATDEGEEIDQDARILSLEKANRARKGQKLNLRWLDGRFVLDETNSLESHAALVQAKETFIAILKRLQSQGRGKGVGVSAKASNYAPRLFEKLPDAQGIKAKMFEKAMEELFKDNILQLSADGPPSKRREYIMINSEIYV